MPQAARLATEPCEITTLADDPAALPLVVRPNGDPSVEHFCAWLAANPDWAQERLAQHGGILFRGFAVASAQDFERLARAIDDDMEHVRDVVWPYLVVYPWQQGDVVAIDNRSVAHGRLPYSGPRKVAVCWA